MACLQACYAAASLAELRDCLGDEYSSFSVIAIDEAQFLPDLLPFCMHAADVENKHVLVAGLDGDFKRQRFGQVRALSASILLHMPEMQLAPPQDFAVRVPWLSSLSPA